jgi:hypothetical protein
MACFLDDYVVFYRGLFSDVGVFPLRGWGKASGQRSVASGQREQGAVFRGQISKNARFFELDMFRIGWAVGGG